MSNTNYFRGFGTILTLLLLSKRYLTNQRKKAGVFSENIFATAIKLKTRLKTRSRPKMRERILQIK